MKTTDRCNPYILKSTDPNWLPWLSYEEAISIVEIHRTLANQNGRKEDPDAQS